MKVKGEDGGKCGKDPDLGHPKFLLRPEKRPPELLSSISGNDFLNLSDLHAFTRAFSRPPFSKESEGGFYYLTGRWSYSAPYG
jgi:hypothetical protein